MAAFEENCGDVERLLDIHRELAGDGPGKKHGVEVLNKSAVVLMCAAWEAYCEDIAAEAIDHLVNHAANASKLPKELRKQIARELERDLDNLAVWRLADDSWRQLLQARTQTLADERNRNLNTPKTANIRSLFRDAIGLPNVPSAWYWQKMSAVQAAEKLDSYVTLRGDIAHRSKAAATIKKSHASKFGEHVKRLVEKTDCYINYQLEKACGRVCSRGTKRACQTGQGGSPARLDRLCGSGCRQRLRKGVRADSEVLRDRDVDDMIAFEQPLGIDDRKPDDLALGVEAEDVPLGRLLAHSGWLAISEMQVEHISAVVVGGVVEGQAADGHCHCVVSPGGSLRLA